MKQLIIIGLGMTLLASCTNSSPAVSSNSDTTTHKSDSAALINTEVSGGVLPDTSLNRRSDSVTLDHTKNNDTGRRKQ